MKPSASSRYKAAQRFAKNHFFHARLHQRFCCVCTRSLHFARTDTRLYQQATAVLPSQTRVITLRFSMQRCLLAAVAVVLLSASCSNAARGRLLLSSESPVNSDTINSILSKGIKIFTFGQNTEIPPPILQGASDLGSFSTPFQPSNGYNTKSSTILFQCRAVGNQIYTVSKCAVLFRRCILPLLAHKAMSYCSCMLHHLCICAATVPDLRTV